MLKLQLHYKYLDIKLYFSPHYMNFCGKMTFFSGNYPTFVQTTCLISPKSDFFQTPNFLLFARSSSFFFWVWGGEVDNHLPIIHSWWCACFPHHLVLGRDNPLVECMCFLFLSTCSACSFYLFIEVSFFLYRAPHMNWGTHPIPKFKFVTMKKYHGPKIGISWLPWTTGTSG